MVVFISIGFSILTIAAIVIDWFLIDPFLQYFTLFYGVFFGYYAIRDTYDDTYVHIVQMKNEDFLASNVFFPTYVLRMM